MARRVQTTHKKCSGCGGETHFCPQTQDLICVKCNRHFEIKKEKVEHKHRYLPNASSQSNESWGKEQKIFKCNSCGAEILLEGLEFSENCPYCDSEYVGEIDALPGLKPDCVIPFAFDKSQASEKFVQAIKKKLFVPNAFKKQLPERQIKGIYFPAFNFDANTKSRYQGVLSKSVQNSKGESVTKNFMVNGEISLSHKDVLVEASQNLTQNTVYEILPYDFEQSFKYNSAYLRGYAAEHYLDLLEDCHSRAQQEMEARVKVAILKRYDYDGVVYLNINSDYANVGYLYTLVPVYNFAYTYKNKKYVTSMNGQTGKICGNVPRSPLKIFFTVFFVLFPFALIFLLVMIFGN